MGKLRNNEKGFGTVEIILIVVIVALIGVVGWFVYKNHNKTTSTSTTTANTTTTKPTTQTSTPTPTTTNKPSEADSLTVKEWGVKVPLSKDISDLTYEVQPFTLNLHDKNQPVIKFFTARARAVSGIICSSNNFPVTLNRGISTDIPITGDGPEPDDTTSNTYGYLYAHNTITPDGHRIRVGLIKVGSYYYTDAIYPGGACDDSTATVFKARSADETSRIDSIVKAVKAMQPL